jgi:hypothetical protein
MAIAAFALDRGQALNPIPIGKRIGGVPSGVSYCNKSPFAPMHACFLILLPGQWCRAFFWLFVCGLVFIKTRTNKNKNNAHHRLESMCATR